MFCHMYIYIYNRIFLSLTWVKVFRISGFFTKKFVATKHISDVARIKTALLRCHCSHHHPRSIPLCERRSGSGYKGAGGFLRYFIFSRYGKRKRERELVLNAGGNIVRVVTEMYSVDIRNDVVQARKRALRVRRKP